MAFFKNVTTSRAERYSERCRKSILLLDNRTYSIKVEMPNEPAGTCQICFLYFISFNMMSFFLENIQNQSNGGCS